MPSRWIRLVSSSQPQKTFTSPSSPILRGEHALFRGRAEPQAAYTGLWTASLLILVFSTPTLPCPAWLISPAKRRSLSQSRSRAVCLLLRHQCWGQRPFLLRALRCSLSYCPCCPYRSEPTHRG